MGQKAGESTEEDEQDRGRHSNLPFDETKNSGGSKKIPAPAGIRRRVLSGTPTEKRFVRQVSWLPDPPLAGLLPGRATVSIRRVQWFVARGVPGDSGGG